MISPVTKEQRRFVLVVIPLDSAKEDLVIATIVAIDDTALEVRRRAVDERDTVLAERIGDARKLVARAARETHREVAVLRAQDVHAEMRSGTECR